MELGAGSRPPVRTDGATGVIIVSETEQFECQDCYLIGPLNQHGACVQCGSQAVLSLEVKEILQLVVDIWKPASEACADCGKAKAVAAN